MRKKSENVEIKETDNGFWVSVKGQFVPTFVPNENDWKILKTYKVKDVK